MNLHRTETRNNIPKPGVPRLGIIRTEVKRPGLDGNWNYHATKGWRRVRAGA